MVDCPPSLNLLTVNALAAADAVVVPLQCEFFALEGLSQLLTTVEQVRRTLNPALAIHGIVLTMYDPRNSLAGQVVADVRAYMGDKVYDTVIPRNVRLSEAPSHGKPALLYDLKCAGSQAYLKLASEVIQREERMARRLERSPLRRIVSDAANAGYPDFRRGDRWIPAFAGMTGLRLKEQEWPKT